MAFSAAGYPSWQGGDLLTLTLGGGEALPLAGVSVAGSGGSGGAANDGTGSGYFVAQGLSEAFSPPLSIGESAAQVALTDASGGVETASLAAWAPLYGSYTFAIRAPLPSTWDVGPRAMAQVPPAGRPTPSMLESVTGSLAEGLNLLGGLPISRLVEDAAAGDATLTVERQAGLPAAGRVQVDGVVYGYSGVAPAGVYTQLQGVGVTLGGQPRAGVQAAHTAGAPAVYVDMPTSDAAVFKDSLFVDTASGPELSILGRNLGVPHSPSIATDDQYRAVIRALAYAPKASVYAITSALDAILGPGEYTLAEDPVGSPCQVQIALNYATIVQPGYSGRTYVAGAQQVAVAADGSLPLAGPVLGLGAAFAVAADGTISPASDYDLLVGADATTAPAGGQTLTFGTQTVPAPTIGLTPALLPSDVGRRLDLTSGSATGHFTIAALADAHTAVVHHGVFSGCVINSSGGVNLLTAPLPDGQGPEVAGAFRYPQDLGRQIVIFAGAGQNMGTRTITALYDSGTGTNLASRATPIIQRTNVCAISGAPMAPDAGTSVAVLPVFASQTGVTYRMSGNLQIQGDPIQNSVTVQPRQALPSGVSMLSVETSDVLSAIVLPSVDLNVTISVADGIASTDPSALYIDAPLAALTDYLSQLTAAGVQPVLELY